MVWAECPEALHRPRSSSTLEVERQHPQRCAFLVLISATVCILISIKSSRLLRFVRWSFGGNRLQIKAEVQLLADVERSLRAVSSLFAKTIGNLQSLAVKQDLLLLLLEDEQTRLVVWLYPLDHEKRHVFSLSHNGKVPSDVSEVHLRKLRIH